MVNKKYLILLAAVALLCLLCGFFVAKGMYDRPIDESVSRDTVTLHDTIPDYHPVPKDSVRLKYVTRWLPAVHDTVYSENYAQDFVEIMHDTVAVQVSITSKHFGGKNYDAYVSGFETNLDSIFVYNETQLITETITRMKPPNRLSLDVEAGADYLTTHKDMATFAFGDLTYKIRDSRFAVGLRGGVIKMPADKAELFVGGVVKLKIF